MNHGDLKALDAAFARRLGQRDGSVMVEIDRIYGRVLRRRLQRFRGEGLKDSDIDDLVQEVLRNLWTNYHEGSGPVSSFVFAVAKTLRQSHFRRFYRLQARHHAYEQAGPVQTSDSLTPYEISANADENRHIMPLVNQACEECLTDLQRAALARRMRAARTSHWAKQLERETGKPAKQWRKASDDAIENVRVYLARHGVDLMDGGRYGVA